MDYTTRLIYWGGCLLLTGLLTLECKKYEKLGEIGQTINLIRQQDRRDRKRLEKVLEYTRPEQTELPEKAQVE